MKRTDNYDVQLSNTHRRTDLVVNFLALSVLACLVLKGVQSWLHPTTESMFQCSSHTPSSEEA